MFRAISESPSGTEADPLNPPFRTSFGANTPDQIRNLWEEKEKRVWTSRLCASVGVAMLSVNERLGFWDAFSGKNPQYYDAEGDVLTADILPLVQEQGTYLLGVTHMIVVVTKDEVRLVPACFLPEDPDLFPNAVTLPEEDWKGVGIRMGVAAEATPLPGERLKGFRMQHGDLARVKTAGKRFTAICTSEEGKCYLGTDLGAIVELVYTKSQKGLEAKLVSLTGSLWDSLYNIPSLFYSISPQRGVLQLSITKDFLIVLFTDSAIQLWRPPNIVAGNQAYFLQEYRHKEEEGVLTVLIPVKIESIRLIAVNQNGERFYFTFNQSSYNPGLSRVGVKGEMPSVENGGELAEETNVQRAAAGFSSTLLVSSSGGGVMCSDVIWGLSFTLRRVEVEQCAYLNSTFKPRSLVHMRIELPQNVGRVLAVAEHPSQRLNQDDKEEDPTATSIYLPPMRFSILTSTLVMHAEECRPVDELHRFLGRLRCGDSGDFIQSPGNGKGEDINNFIKAFSRTHGINDMGMMLVAFMKDTLVKRQSRALWALVAKDLDLSKVFLGLVGPFWTRRLFEVIKGRNNTSYRVRHRPFVLRKLQMYLEVLLELQKIHIHPSPDTDQKTDPGQFAPEIAKPGPTPLEQLGESLEIVQRLVECTQYSVVGFTTNNGPYTGRTSWGVITLEQAVMDRDIHKELKRSIGFGGRRLE